MTKLKPYFHILAAGAISLVVLGAYGGWYATVSSRSAEAAQLSSEVRALGEIGGRAAAIRRALEDLDLAEAEAYGHFVDDRTIVGFLEEVESTGRQLGATVEIVSVGNTSGKTARPPVQMSVRISGAFDAVMRTVGAIEYQAYDTTLTAVTLDRPPGQGASWTAAATFLVGTRPDATATSTKP